MAACLLLVGASVLGTAGAGYAVDATEEASVSESSSDAVAPAELAGEVPSDSVAESAEIVDSAPHVPAPPAPEEPEPDQPEPDQVEPPAEENLAAAPHTEPEPSTSDARDAPVAETEPIAPAALVSREVASEAVVVPLDAGGLALTLGQETIDRGLVEIGEFGYLATGITNVGDAETGPLAFAGFEPPSNEFSDSWDNCQGRTVAPGEQCLVRWEYTPVDVGADTDTFTFEVSDGTGVVELTVTLMGEGSEPSVGVRLEGPASLAFDPTALGVTATLPVSFVNTGDAAGTVSVPDWTMSPSESPFELTSISCGYLAPGDACTGTVQFRPRAMGSFQSTLTVELGVGTSITEHVIEITGEGRFPLEADPLLLDFGPVLVGGTSTLPITLTNVGEATLDAVRFVELPPDPYTMDMSACRQLAGGQSCDILVTFAPPAVGDYSEGFLSGEGVLALPQPPDEGDGTNPDEGGSDQPDQSGSDQSDGEETAAVATDADVAAVAADAAPSTASAVAPTLAETGPAPTAPWLALAAGLIAAGIATLAASRARPGPTQR